MAEENNGSIFGKFRKKAAPAAPAEGLPPPPPRLPQFTPPPLPPLPMPALPDGKAAELEVKTGALSAKTGELDAKTAELAGELAALRGELEALKNRPETPAAPPPPQGGGEEFAFRLGRAEAVLAELRGQVSAGADALRAEAAKAATRDELKDMGLRVSDLSVSFDGLRRTFSSEGELAGRLEQAEGAVAALKTALEGQQRRLKGELEALAPRALTDEMRVNLSGAVSALDEMKLNFAQYSEELAAVAAECRKALGEAQGLAKAAAQGGVAGRFDEHLKDLVAKLSARLSEVETAMHAGVAELAARMNSNEVLYNKMFSAAEERLAKGLEPKLKDIDGQLRWLRESVIRLSDDYAVVAERRMRALEAKYSAFETIARRMDAIDAALKKAGRIGLP
ncbi:MAG: hypothetical protein PHV33_08775 [Elusimicrobiales bacterium]|nr:hypothetical protein [Elusimicrobiales bacterium]